MSLGSPLLLALLLAQAAPVEVRLEAERLLHDGVHARTTAEGHAKLRSAELALDADRILYEKAEGRVTAVGHVVARLAKNGLTAIVADTVSLRLEGDEVEEVSFFEGNAITHKGVSAEAFLAASTEAELARAGTPSLRLDGNRLVREGRTWRLEHLSLVPCDCDLAHPTWGVHAVSANIDPVDERAGLWWPVVWVGPVPVFALPWTSLPLTNRASGLLFPKPNGTTLNGFVLELPVFITLGRSADLTLTPGYIFGAEAPKPTADKPVPDPQNPNGTKGARLGAELRYTPAVGTEGRLAAGLLYDLLLPRNALDASALGTGVRGLRWEMGWMHKQELPAGFSLRADLNAYSDGYMLRDLVSDVLGKEASYLRSTAVLAHRSRDTWAGLDVAIRQDVQQGFGFFEGLPAASSYPATWGARPRWAGPAPIQKLPSLRFVVPAITIAGPLAFDFAASATRHAPLVGPTGDEGPLANEGRPFDPVTGAELSTECLRQRLYVPILGDGDFTTPCGVTLATKQAGQGDRKWQPGEREGRERVDVKPRLFGTWHPGEALTVAASAAWRQGAWWGEQSGTSLFRGYPVFDARAETSLVGHPGSPAWTHLLRPLMQARAVPFVLGGDPAPYDEIDLAFPGVRGRSQGLVELQQRLSKTGSDVTYRLDLGQGFDLTGPDVQAPTPNESYGRAGLTWGWVSANLSARRDPVRGMWTRRSASGALSDGAGHGVSAAIDDLLDDGSSRTRGGLDLLFGTRLPAGVLTRSQLLTGSVWWKAGVFTLRYDARLYSDNAGGAILGTVEADGTTGLPLALKSQTLTVGVSPACDCWRLDGYLTHQPSPTTFWTAPNFGFSVTVSNFGTIGAAR